MSPDGSLFASDCKDGKVMLLDANNGKQLCFLDAGCAVYALAFSPKHYWLAVATDTLIKVWDLENKSILVEIRYTSQPTSGFPRCVSVTWSADGSKLSAGCTDGNVYVYEVGQAQVTRQVVSASHQAESRCPIAEGSLSVLYSGPKPGQG